MISTDITGAAGGSQIFDLLALVSNPAVYESKIRALIDATEEHKKYVEAVGPVSEILKLREDTLAVNKAAVQELEDAKAEAKQIKAEAKAKAQETLEVAKAKAAKLTDDVEAKVKVAETRLLDAESAAKLCEKERAELAKARQELEHERSLLQAAAEMAKAELQKAQNLKDSLLAKTAAFAQELAK